MDEILRAIWGLCACWPMMRLAQKLRLKSLPTCVLLTFYMVPVWWLYTQLECWLCG